MRVAADANVLAAALLRPEGWTAKRLASGDFRGRRPGAGLHDRALLDALGRAVLVPPSEA